MKILLITIMLILISGCSEGMNVVTKTNDIKLRCIDGVSYYMFKEMSGNQGYGFMTVAFNRDGSVKTCTSN